MLFSLAKFLCQRLFLDLQQQQQQQQQGPALLPARHGTTCQAMTAAEAAAVQATA
jgi:hypothetical protein